MKNEIKGLIVLLLGAALLGFSAIFVKWSAPASPLVVGFYRMAFALPFILGLALKSGGAPMPTSAGLWAVIAGLCFTGDLALWHSAMHFTTVASSTLLVCIAPLWVALVMVAFFGSRLRLVAWAGLFLALLGAASLAVAKGARLSGNFGEFLSLLSSFCYAAYTLALSKARKGASAIRTLLWVSVSCLVFFGVAAWLHGDAFHGFSWKAWLSLAALGLLVQGLGWWFISWGFGHVSTHVGAVGLLMQSVTTVILGRVMLGERLMALQALGTLFILAGIGICSLSPPVPRAAQK